MLPDSLGRLASDITNSTQLKGLEGAKIMIVDVDDGMPILLVHIEFFIINSSKGIKILKKYLSQ